MLKIPNQIIAGDTTTWNDAGLRGLDPATGETTNYTNDKFTLTWAIRGTVALNLTAVPNNSGYRTTITSAESATLTPGLYFWQAFVTDADNNRVTICSGQLNVISNLATGEEAFDGRSEVQQMFDAVTAVIKSRLEGGAVLRYQIKGRDLWREPMPDLIKLRDRLKVELAREKAAGDICQGLGDPRRLFVRFR